MEWLLIPLFGAVRYLHGRGTMDKTSALFMYAFFCFAYLTHDYLTNLIVGVLVALGFIPGWTAEQQASLDGYVQPNTKFAWWSWLDARYYFPKGIEGWVDGATAMSWRWFFFFTPAFIALQSWACTGLWLIGFIYMLCGKFVPRAKDGGGDIPNRVAEPLTGAWLGFLLVIS